MQPLNRATTYTKEKNPNKIGFILFLLLKTKSKYKLVKLLAILIEDPLGQPY